MDFSCIVLFLALYYLKPQEWTSLFATIRFVQFTMLASWAANLTPDWILERI